MTGAVAHDADVPPVHGQAAVQVQRALDGLASAGDGSGRGEAPADQALEVLEVLLPAFARLSARAAAGPSLPVLLFLVRVSVSVVSVRAEVGQVVRQRDGGHGRRLVLQHAVHAGDGVPAADVSYC